MAEAESGPGMRGSRKDTALSIVLLLTAILLTCVGWFTVYVVVGLTSTDSGPQPRGCIAAPITIGAYPVLGFSFVIVGASWVVYRKVRHERGWWVAAFAVAGVLAFMGVVILIWLSLAHALCG